MKEVVKSKKIVNDIQKKKIIIKHTGKKNMLLHTKNCNYVTTNFSHTSVLKSLFS